MGSTNINERDELPHYGMNAGDGPQSYDQNSSYQRGVLDVAKSIIEEEIVTKLNIKERLVKKAVFVADFGCSTGHNSFRAMQIITEAINKIYEFAEFHVLFNDVASNDFNTLFTSLPPDRVYRATGVPGDFHGRLLPESSLHFAYSCWSLNWLTQVPKAVADDGSPAWNKGAIFYTEKRKEISAAYLDQYRKDMEGFLESRAVEMVEGGLMALLIPAVPESWNPEREYTPSCVFNLLGSCLMDMVKMGRLSEEKIDSFNIPHYYPTPQQLMAILKGGTQSFIIERIEILDNPGKHMPSINARATGLRAALGGMFSFHFGDEIMDELFDLYKKKVAASPVFLNPDNDETFVILAVLKRKAK